MDPTRRKRRLIDHRGKCSLSRFGMLALISALILGLILPSASSAQDNGQRKPSEPATMREALAKARPKIVGGSPVAAGEAKFAVFVFALVDPNTGSGFQCGGSLISSRFVLTAAHCVEDENGVQFDPEQFILIIGDANIADIPDESFFGVVDVSQHPEWDPLAFANDAAVLELDRSVPSSLATPIQLVAEGNTSLDQPGQDVTVVGWGRTSGGGQTSDQLLKANLKVVSDATCDSIFGGIDDASVICASAPSQTSCQGDSGGPLFATVANSSARGKADRAKANKQKEVKAEKQKNKKKKKHKKKKKKKGGGGSTPQTTAIQIGVVSFGPVGCGVGIPAGYAQVSSSEIHDFIDGVVN